MSDTTETEWVITVRYDALDHVSTLLDHMIQYIMNIIVTDKKKCFVKQRNLYKKSHNQVKRKKKGWLSTPVNILVDIKSTGYLICSTPTVTHSVMLKKFKMM